MIKTFAQLLAEEKIDTIESALKVALNNANETPFWSQKVTPLAHAVLSVLVPLRDQGLLFDPEGKPQERLTPSLVLRWCDLVSLKTLAFTLQKSNEAGRLLRTSLPEEACTAYTPIDLTLLGTYLSGYTVNLENEALDFPIAHYNLHTGIAGVLEPLMK
ncbi:hypothetical protein ACXWTF_11030 [Thiomicrolovo sp. ZZH C-3]|uniref:hypothetical protein n=1 Tax=Sulfurimonas sp. ST-25 TaxID=3400151 RepID=UPI003A8B945B